MHLSAWSMLYQCLSVLIIPTFQHLFLMSVLPPSFLSSLSLSPFWILLLLPSFISTLIPSQFLPWYHSLFYPSSFSSFISPSLLLPPILPWLEYNSSLNTFPYLHNKLHLDAIGTLMIAIYFNFKDWNDNRKTILNTKFSCVF